MQLSTYETYNYFLYYFYQGNLPFQISRQKVKRIFLSCTNNTNMFVSLSLSRPLFSSFFISLFLSASSYQFSFTPTSLFYFPLSLLPLIDKKESLSLSFKEKKGREVIMHPSVYLALSLLLLLDPSILQYLSLSYPLVIPEQSFRLKTQDSIQGDKRILEFTTKKNYQVLFLSVITTRCCIGLSCLFFFFFTRCQETV